MSIQQALRAALGEIFGPAARGAGFKGSAPTWRKVNAAGDWAIVNVKSSMYSTASSVKCMLNIAVAPEPWLAWQRYHLGEGCPKQVQESLGLFQEQLWPTGTRVRRDGFWQIDDPSRARRAVQDMALQFVARGRAELDRRLDRKQLLEEIRGGRLGRTERRLLPTFFARAEAILIAEEGPSAHLDQLLAQASVGLAPNQQEHAQKLEAWVRARAEHAAARRPE